MTGYHRPVMPRLPANEMRCIDFQPAPHATVNRRTRCVSSSWTVCVSHLMYRLAHSEDEPGGGKVSQVGGDSSGPSPGLPASADDDTATRVFSHHGQVTWPQRLTNTVEVPPTGTPGVNAPSDGGPYASTAPGKIVRCPSL